MKPDKSILSLYVPHDNTFSINVGDIDLTPITLSLPDPPPLELVDGYGLPPEEQYFKYMDVPRRLRIIEKEVYDKLKADLARNINNTITIEKAIDIFWEYFEDRRNDLIEEENYIKKVIWCRNYGYWFFNDGKPTYITGDHFDFLNFWRMQDVPENGGRPQYRDRDRRKYLYYHYLETCTETFADIDADGRAVKIDGKYHMKDVGGRVFYGGIEVKNRRCGATHQACHKIKKGVESMFGGYGTIVSMDGDNAVVHFTKKLLPALNDYPLFLKAKWDGNNTSKSIKYRTRNNDYVNQGLNGIIDYTESASELKNDGDKLHYLLSDEGGKASKSHVDILERHNVNKLAQSTGGGSTINGFCIHPSTVEMMNEGGAQFRKLTELSNFYRRIDGKGQTLSGLGLVFFHAQDGLENFIDRFGMSVINKPTERQKMLSPDALFSRMNIGAYDYLMKERQSLLRDGSPRAMETYRSIRRKMPMSFAECWIGTSGDMGFDLEKIDQRLMELERKSKVIKGNFKWEGGVVDSNVIFVPDENGRFEVSLLLDRSQSNLKTKVRVYNPRTAKYEWQWRGNAFLTRSMGVDPVEYTTKTESKMRDDASRQSDFSFSTLQERDLTIDKSDDPNTWKTRRCIQTYCYRPASMYDANEDALMCAVYYGAGVEIENNKKNTIQHFIERGYGGFLVFDLDPVTGRPKETPGIYATVNTINELFAEIKDYIAYHSHVCEHVSLLKQFKMLRGREELTKYDLAASFGWALVRSKRMGGIYTRKEIKVERGVTVRSVIGALTG